MENKTPHVFRSFLLSVLHAVLFIIIYILAILLIYFILLIASKIPVIKNIAGMLLTYIENRGDGIVICSMYFSLTAAYYAAEYLLLQITKHDPTRWLSLKLSGIWLAIFSILTLVANFINGEYKAWLICAGFLICSLIIYSSSNKYTAGVVIPVSLNLEESHKHSEKDFSTAEQTEDEFREGI